MGGRTDSDEEELVSIIMPAYNSANYIVASIQSVIGQTYNNWELLFIDDCSTDNTIETVEQFKDARIRVLKNQKNSGAAISRNYGLREAKGKWIAFLDSDDIWKPEKLETQIQYMTEKNIDFSFHDYRVISNGQPLSYVCIAPNKVNKRRMYNYCYFFTSTVMYNRGKIGLLQIADLKKNNDYAMWLKIIEKADAYRIPKCMAYYTKRSGSISSVKKIKLIKWHYILFKDGLGKNKFTSVVLTINNIFHGTIKKLFFKRPATEND